MRKSFLLLVLIYLIPLVMDNLANTSEVIWLLYLFPSVFLPFTYGKKGGIISAVIGTFIHSLNELLEIFIDGEKYSSVNIWSMIIISILNFIIAITIGILVDRLKNEQHSLQKAVKKMEYMAFHDYLTGLPNRWSFEIQLKNALAEAKKKNCFLAVLFLDLDRFKLINESLGHSNGDVLLKQVSKRLCTILKDGDYLARQGGDEFIFSLNNLKSDDQAKDYIKEILHFLEQPFIINDQEYYITCSIGASFYPLDGLSWEELIQHADIAMFSSKELGRNSYQFYHKGSLQKINDVVKIESHLRKAIQQNEFTLHYQPLVDLKKRKIIGMEALIRWRNIELGSVSPAEFIPLAEEIGLIGNIGEWVLREACTQAKFLSKQTETPIKVAVNISSKQFQDKNFVQIVKKTLLDTELSPKQLELEITESVSMDNMEEVIEKLKALKEMGMTIAIDDFGTGYSSISYLKSLPIDTLKIDQSFIKSMLHNMKDRAVVEGIISLSKSFGFNVTAEGVETEDQMHLLQGFQCSQVQGYLFSKPVPIQEFYQFIQMFEQRTILIDEFALN
ncbi:MAG: bifunctional diguanylate cyclase/phosphodiesterase [Bacillota bacterium]|nr:bifunctional diguanylate cyclase/phosphodiesterase [Bacillota bacterium]